jgi:hypothetical protein
MAHARFYRVLPPLTAVHLISCLGRLRRLARRRRNAAERLPPFGRDEQELQQNYPAGGVFTCPRAEAKSPPAICARRLLLKRAFLKAAFCVVTYQIRAGLLGAVARPLQPVGFAVDDSVEISSKQTGCSAVAAPSTRYFFVEELRAHLDTRFLRIGRRDDFSTRVDTTQ